MPLALRMQGGHLFPLSMTGATLLGRAPFNQIILPHPDVSSAHCLLVPSRKGKGYALIDAWSRLGTAVNGRASCEQVVDLGDVVSIGPFDLEVVACEAAAGSAPAPQPPVAGRPLWELIRDGRRSMPRPLSPANATVVGRGAYVDLRVEDRWVSDVHCLFAPDTAGGLECLLVVDLHSSNGTHVNGRLIQSRRIAPGDVVALGQVEFELRPAGAGAHSVDARLGPPRRRAARFATTAILTPDEPLPEPRASAGQEDAGEDLEAILYELSMAPADAEPKATA